MTSSRLLLLAMLLASPGGQGAEGPDAARALVEQLGADRYPERVEATEALWQRGDDALPAIEAAARSSDPEVRVRAAELLRRIQLGITPESAPEVVELVLRYDEAEPAERRRIIRSLKALRAWRQVLRLHAMETDPATLQQIESELERVPITAARELLAGDEPDWSSAREFLEIARPSPEVLLMRAELERLSGRLREELKSFEDRDDADSLAWRRALHLVAGDLADARRLSERMGKSEAAARLAVLEGDPLPWIRQAIVPDHQIAPTSLDTYRDAVVGLWEGRPVPDRIARGLASMVRDDAEEEGFSALAVLFSLGRTELAEPLLMRASPGVAFDYYETRERVDEALLALGLDPADPDYVGFCKKRFDLLVENYEENRSEIIGLARIGHFLGARGLDSALSECFVAPLVALGEHDEGTFLEVIEGMFAFVDSYRLASSIYEAAAIHAGDSEPRWAAIRQVLFGQEPYSTALWTSLEQFRPEAAGAERLSLMATLSGLIADRSGDVGAWWEWMSEGVGAGERPDEKLGLMLAVSGVQADAVRFVEATRLCREHGFELDELGEFSRRLRPLESHFLAAAGEWEEVVAGFREKVALVPQEPIGRAYLASALRRAGREDQARAEEGILERLTLGEPRVCRQIGSIYANSGDFDRAGHWWQRAALLSVDQEMDFSYTAELLYLVAKERGDWVRAAAIGEMSLMLSVMDGANLENMGGLLRIRIEIEMSRAVARLDRDRERSLEVLEDCHSTAITDGVLADYFFPVLREQGLVGRHDRWFEESWQLYSSVLERFPESHNTMNTAAWTASRANRRLAEAEELSRRSLELLPDQPAYLDTMAEVWFARRDRARAVGWSDRAVAHDAGMLSYETFVRQNSRFRHGPFPVK